MGPVRHERVPDQPLQNLVLEMRAQHFGKVGTPETLLHLEPAVARLLNGDLLPPRLSGVVRVVDVQVHDAIGTPGREHEGECAQQCVLEPFVATETVADALKHESEYSDNAAPPRFGAGPGNR